MRLPFLPSAALVLTVGLVAPAVALGAPTSAEFPAGTSPTAIARGADDNVWVGSQSSRGALTRITQDGTPTTFTNGLSNGAVQDITAGPGGLWFTKLTPDEDGRDLIGRVTTAGAISQWAVGPRSTPTGIAAGPDGNLWYTATGQDGAVARITPTGTVTEYTAGLPGAPQDITRGADGNLWFTFPEARRIGRITPQGVITLFGAGILTGMPQEITAGPDGNLWFTQTGMTASVGRITPAGVITQFSSGLAANSVPRAITTGADGNLYVTDTGSDTIRQVTPDGVIAQYGAVLASGADPRGITTGGDGRLWLADRNRGKVVRTTVAPGAGPTTDSSVTATTATVSSAVRPNSEATTYRFDWGTTTAYGQSTASTSAGAGATTQPAAAALTGLVADTTYHVRLSATNATGTTLGPDRTFTTAGLPPGEAPVPVDADSSPPTAPPTAPVAPASPDVLAPAAAPTPVPEVGRTAVASVVSGTIRIRPPGSSKSVVLGADAAIPSGSVIDARAGTLELASAIDKKGRTQRARFRGATFGVALSRRDQGYVDLRLAQAPTGCRPASTRARAARAAPESARKAPVKLWAKDNKGRYRTHGRNSVATVRGTEWTTTESCTGTLTRVVKGAVSVRDTRSGRRTLVRAGHSHLARTRP